jgi:hypothetical protein
VPHLTIECPVLWRAAAELDSDVDALVFPEDCDLDDVAGFEAFDGFAEVGDRLNVLAVDGDDQVGSVAARPTG